MREALGVRFCTSGCFIRTSSRMSYYDMQLGMPGNGIMCCSGLLIQLFD